MKVNWRWLLQMRIQADNPLPGQVVDVARWNESSSQSPAKSVFCVGVIQLWRCCCSWVSHWVPGYLAAYPGTPYLSCLVTQRHSSVRHRFASGSDHFFHQWISDLWLAAKHNLRRVIEPVMMNSMQVSSDTVGTGISQKGNQ